MKVLLAATPIIGHVNPMVKVAHILRDAGHETAFYTGSLFAEKIKPTGARFFSLPEDVDYDIRNLDALFPDRRQYLPGPEQLLFDMKRTLIDSMTSQFQGLKAILREFEADLVVHETIFCGVLPLLLGPREARPMSACLSVTPSILPREDGAPFGLGLQPARDEAQREEYRSIAQGMDAGLNNPVREYTDLLLHKLGVHGLPAPLFQSVAALSDVVLQTCVPGFEFPIRRQEARKQYFVGAILPEGSGDVPPQVEVAKEEGRKIVLVTQGTVANGDLGQLVAPVIRALGDRDDLLILATTGGRPSECVPVALPRNTVVSEFLNFRELLPEVDVLIAFGGYGTVTQALSFGVPMVLAGLTEEKPEIAARVVWRGSGINLPTSDPTDDQVREAVETILIEPSYRSRARELAREFAGYDPAQRISDVLESLVANREELVG